MINFLDKLNYYFVRNGFFETVGRVMLRVTAVLLLVAIVFLVIAIVWYKFEVVPGLDSIDPKTMQYAWFCVIGLVCLFAWNVWALREDL